MTEIRIPTSFNIMTIVVAKANMTIFNYRVIPLDLAILL
jgi:hypothetical protein